MTLAFLDLDGLKDVNDALGHRTGDDLLIALAARLRDLLPARAFCGRFDGDEFAVVMTSRRTPTSAEAAMAALDRRAGAAVLDQRPGGAGRRHRGPGPCAARRADAATS